MGQLSAEQVAQRAIEAGLVTSRQLQEVWGVLAARSSGAPEFLQALIRRGLLTQYQADRLMKGEKTGFFYGDYKVLYQVGMGTFARVFRAAHRATGQVVAIKALRSRFADNSAQYQSFLREGEIGRALLHPNIVAIYEVHSRGKEHYLVMEFVEGQTLQEFVKIRRQLDAKEATRLLVDIARGLDHAFERSVAHRDLKMSNVLISSRGEAKLVDFGLAAMDPDGRSAGDDATGARTIPYAALERATGVRRDDTRSDIFFAGCIYYHMLCGKSPLYEGRQATQRLTRSRFQAIVPIHQALPTVPPAVAVVVNKAMALAPSRRYQTPGELLADAESAVRRLEESPRAGEPDEAAPLAQGGEHSEAGRPQRRVMVVETNLAMQNLLREGLKKAGYRVLLTGDPQWALDRFGQEPGVADCILFSAQEIGEPALDGFNRALAYPSMRSLPALLLLAESQRAWSPRAKTSHRRRTIPLPITMKQLRDTLEELLAAEESSQKPRDNDLSS